MPAASSAVNRLRQRATRRLGSGAAVCLAVVTLSTAAATAPLGRHETPAESFAETIEVRVVNLEVVVTDSHGERVTGLQREDFVVRVDGEPVPILYFSERGEPERRGPTHPEDSDPGSGVSFLVFIDDHVTLKRDRDFTLLRLRRELPLLRVSDRMAVVAYDGRRLEVLAPWSGSLATLDAALAAAIERPAGGIRWVALARMPGFIANWIGNASRRSILAASSSLHTLPAPRGRKVMLLVAGSWDPVEVGRADDFSPWCVSQPCFGNFVFTALTDTANLLGYSIYAADVEGRDVHDSWRREQRLQDTLALLTRETGGKVLLNADRGRLLSITSADSRAFYSIGFEPRDPDPNRRHRIEVEALRPELTARSRESFVAATRRRLRDLEATAALLGGSGERGPSFPVQLQSFEPLPGRRMRLPVSVFAPVGALNWLPADGIWRARFEVQLAAVDARGNSSEIENHEIEVEEPVPASARDLEHLEFALELTRRRHTIAVRVRDLQGEGVFTAVAEMSPIRLDR